MKRTLMLLAVGIVALAGLVGCSALQQQSLASAAANAQTKITQACTVVQPTLLDLSASVPGNANLALLTKDNAKVCAAVAALDPTNVNTLINTTIPEAIGLVGLLPIDDGTQSAIKLALGAASLALSNWLAVYGQPAATAPDPASAPAGASTAVVAAS